MIEFHYELDFALPEETDYSDWIYRVIVSEGKVPGDVSYIFCDDAYLLKLNKRYLAHDTFTDIITFDYTEGNRISGDVFISTERVRENAIAYQSEFEEELRRVMAHGVLHLVGYGDKSEKEAKVMRKKEDEKIGMFHVEH